VVGVEAGAHRKLCTIELIAEGHADRCPGEDCAFWSSGCALERVESELGSRPEVATLLLELRREVEAGLEVPVATARERLVAASYHLGDEDGPAGGATELV
jgi:hypothetical protein